MFENAGSTRGKSHWGGCASWPGRLDGVGRYAEVDACEIEEGPVAVEDGEFGSVATLESNVRWVR